MSLLTALLLSVCQSAVPNGLQEWFELCSEGDWSSAAEAAAMVYQADSSGVDALAALMISAVMDDPTQDISSLAKAAVSMDSSSPLAWTASAAVLLQRGPDWHDQAREALSIAAELDTSSVMSPFVRGLLLEREGDLGSAMLEYAAAMELDPGFDPAALQYGRMLAALGMPEGAIEVFETMDGSGPSAMEALAERVLLLDSLGFDANADSLAALITAEDAGIWLQVSLHYALREPSLASVALDRLVRGTGDPVLLAQAASAYLDMGQYSAALETSELALAASADSSIVLPVMGEALLEEGELREAEEAFLAHMVLEPGSVPTLNRLGWISERKASTGTAVEYYLEALELDPENGFARDRLRVITEDEYDPMFWTTIDTGFSLSGSVDLSLERGNRNLTEAGGSASLSYRFDQRGSSIDLGLGARMIEWESTTGLVTRTRRTDTGRASLMGDYWMDDNFYVAASCSWDRQRFSDRPWQVSAYVAGGWQEWLTSWLWLSPELGGGLISTSWSPAATQEYTEQYTIYSSAGLVFEKPHTFIQQAEIFGEIYFPPGNPEEFISSGEISLAFRTWDPLYFSLGYIVDYTRSPEISTWKKYDTRFYTSVNFNLL